jgi:hypothetical protein
MVVGLSILLQRVVNFVGDDLEFDFFCLFLPLNFKSYFFMSSKIMSGDMSKSSVSESDPIISVLISNYPLANGGYLVSFGKDRPDGSFENYDPANSFNFVASKLSTFLEYNAVFLPRGCYYLPELNFAPFIRSLFCGVSSFDMKLLPASHQMQGLLMVQVNESSFLKYEQEEEA